MSQKQIEANRCNARKSTGPRTPNGKAAAKLNALKHGILSSQVVVQGWKIHESSEAFDSLRKQFWEQLTPVGPIEEMLVDEIVSTYWRKRRVMIAESGEIVLSVDNGCWKRGRSSPFDNLAVASLSPLFDVAEKLEESALGLFWLTETLFDVRFAVEKDGEITDAALQKTHLFTGKPNSLTDRLAALRTLPIENADGLDEAALKAKRRDKILAEIDRIRKHYFELRQATIKREKAEESARQAAAVLPSSETLDKILRYETTLERQLYRAMNQLERLQRLRKGEAVPPPLSLEFSTR